MNDRKLYCIKLRHQWWIDAGIVGLHSIAVDLTPVFSDIEVAISSDGSELQFIYESENNLRLFLQECYEELAKRHWNVSTKKQREQKEWVVYNQEQDQFELRPKRQPTPIPALFVKGSSWRANAVPIDELYLQEPKLAHRAEQYVNQEKRTFWGAKKQLLFEPAVCHAALVILPEEKRKKSVCSVCGRASSSYDDVSQPAYLLFASQSAAKSFNSELKGPDKICWECSLLSRFAIETALYRKMGDKLFILQIISPSLSKMYDLQGTLGVRSHIRELDEEYFLSNIAMKDGFLYRAQKPHEFLWAYYYKVYTWFEENNQQTSDDLLFLKLMGIALEQAPIHLGLLVSSSKGQTFLIDELIVYDETAYIFRLLHALRRTEPQIDLKAFYFDLQDRMDDKNPTMYRNRILRRVMEKKLIIKEVERFAFHISREGQYPNLNHILQFTVIYESLIRQNTGADGEGEGMMNTEQIKIATQMGKQIVYSARDYLCGDDAKHNDELKKIKGNLFTLRKTRTLEDFMNQINTFQMRYGIIVSKDYTEGAFEKCSFEHAKAYVMTSALNSYNLLIYRKAKEEGEEKHE